MVDKLMETMISANSDRGLKKCSSLQDESASPRIKNGRLVAIAAKLHFYCDRKANRGD